jgi:hypothetical protein
MKHNTYPIKTAILCEDSCLPDVADFAKDILPFPIKFCYNESRLGQMGTIERYTPLIQTPYVFHLEDDYEFFAGGFIELSLKILDSDPNISQVLLEDQQYTFPTIDMGNPLCLKLMTNKPEDIYGPAAVNNGDGPLSCFSWRPSLKRIEIQRLRMPYELWDDEYTIQLLINKYGYYSVIARNHIGFCTHIGQSAHISIRHGRHDFPDKMAIRLADI